MSDPKKFLECEAGAVTIDWVALTASILLLGVAAVYAIFNVGAAPVVGTVNATLDEGFANIDTGNVTNLAAQNVGSGG